MRTGARRGLVFVAAWSALGLVLFGSAWLEYRTHPALELPQQRPANVEQSTFNRYLLEIDKVYDGDTITATVYLDFGIALPHQPIRLQGYDAPEITRTRQTVRVTEAEITRGKRAKVDLEMLLAAYPGQVYLMPVGDGRGEYNRLTGYVVIFPRDQGPSIGVAEYMQEHGHERNR